MTTEPESDELVAKTLASLSQQAESSSPHQLGPAARSVRRAHRSRLLVQLTRASRVSSTTSSVSSVPS